MAAHITIAPAPGTYVVRIGDTVLGTTSRALELREGSYPPVIYVPREDMDMALLRKTDRHTVCPWKGEASYYSVSGGDRRLENAVWSYETPKEGVADIAGHLAFYPDRATVERT